MAKLILVANWKNRPASLPEAQALLKQLSRKKLLYKRLALFIAPPLAYFESVAKGAKSFASLASQDLSLLDKGAHTGAVTVEIFKSFGVRLAILGHSERRAEGETSLEVSNKIKIALKASITPLVCVGETVQDHEGEHFEFLRQQIKSSLAGLGKKEALRMVLAYEPVWAIGKSAKEALNPAELAQTITFIKKVLTDLFGRALAEKVPILYGGAVEPEDAELLVNTGVRGFLVGHASLNAKNFEKIASLMLA